MPAREPATPAADLVPVETGLFGQLLVPGDPAHTAEIEAAAARAAVFAVKARADNTRRAYRKAWAAYQDWCARLGFAALGADPQLVGMYLAARAERLSVSTLRVHLAAILAAHRLVGLMLDVRHPAIANVVNGIERTKGRAPGRQAAPVLPEFLKPMVSTLPATIAGLRDRAMLLLGFGAAARRAELVALDRADVALHAKGVTIRIRRSKTDQTGEGAMLAIHAATDPAVCPRRALAAWLEVLGDEPGPLFTQIRKSGEVTDLRLSPEYVGRLVKRTAAACGLDAARYSGHSLRAGLATSAAIRGATLDRIMRQTRHRSHDTARRYVRDAEIWRDNVTAGVFDQADGPASPNTGAPVVDRQVG